MWAVATVFEFPDQSMPNVNERRVLQRPVEIQVKINFNLLKTYAIYVLYNSYS